MTRSMTFSAGGLRRAARSPEGRRRPGGGYGWLVLLPAVRGVDSGEREEVHHPEVAGDPTASRRKRRPPVALREVGISVELQKPEEYFADDPAADGPEGQAVCHDLRFSQDVVAHADDPRTALLAARV